MRRKVLQDISNTLGQMLVGWRMQGDLETLAHLPDGTLAIDVLSGSALHESSGTVSLHVTGELQTWFFARLEHFKIPIGAISNVSILANIRTDRIATNRKRVVSFDFNIKCIVATAERSYIGKLSEVHRWHNRVPSN